MFIENPHKKESYSFRIKPELLENIKNYAKATDQTVPEILNEMIEEKTKDLHLTNDYLENKLSFNGVIGLPPLTEIYDNGKYKEFSLFSNTENKVLYEIQRVPNNLDIWTDKEGYTSQKRGVDHEGISFVLAPELITKPEYLETPELLFCCFVPIYFEISIKKQTISAHNISFENAFKKINKAPNIRLLDDFTRFTQMVKELVLAYSNRFKNATRNPDGTYYAGGFNYKDKNQLLIDLYNKLKIELSEYSINVNTNVLSHQAEVIKRTTNKEELLNSTLVTDNPVQLWNEIDELKDELRKSTKENDELKETVTNLQQQIDDIQKVWLKISREENTREEILDHISKG